MLERYAPPSILVGSDHSVVHLSDNAGRYLQHPGGEPTNNVFKLVREEFRLELRTALHSARDQRTTWRSRPIPVLLDGADQLVILRVSLDDKPELEGLILIIFDEVDENTIEPVLSADESDARAREVVAELEATRSRMQGLIEEFETSQEEMRAANEELQSANEELRSTMEELETSREELQSVNEELQTVNQENRHKVEELSQLSSDLQNLLQATDVATIFLDRNLRILRYTPRVSEIFNVRHTDRGRPLADLTHRLGYDKLIDDARRVLQTLVPTEHEVAGPSSQSWYVLRVAPYRTMDDRIEGVVITLIDVTALKDTEFALRRSEERQAFLVRLQDATRVLSDPTQIQTAASRLLGEHLGVNRVTYSEIEGADAVVRGAYVHGVEPLPSPFAIAQLGAALHAAYGRRAGRDQRCAVRQPVHRKRTRVPSPLGHRSTGRRHDTRKDSGRDVRRAELEPPRLVPRRRWRSSARWVSARGAMRWSGRGRPGTQTERAAISPDDRNGAELRDSGHGCRRPHPKTDLRARKRCRLDGGEAIGQPFDSRSRPRTARRASRSRAARARRTAPLPIARWHERKRHARATSNGATHVRTVEWASDS